MRLIRSVFNWFLGTIFVLGGPLYFLFGVSVIVVSFKAKSWPTAMGTILSSEVVEHRCNGVSYSPQVRYHYQVGDSAFDGTHISLLDGGSWEGSAKTTIAKFPAGSQVRVFYPQRHPEDAILMPGTNWYMYATTAMGLLVFVVGIFIHPIRKMLFKKAVSSPA